MNEKFPFENLEFIVGERVQVNPDNSRAMSALTFNYKQLISEGAFVPIDPQSPPYRAFLILLYNSLHCFKVSLCQWTLCNTPHRVFLILFYCLNSTY